MRAPCNGLTALIVEDDWLLREDIAGEFREEGWVVLEAGTIDFVTDIGLADAAMTRWDVAEAVRIAYPEIPVIYSSGGAEDDRRRVFSERVSKQAGGSAGVYASLLRAVASTDVV